MRLWFQCLCAFLLGVKDGFAQPTELTMGRSWESDEGETDAYDRGANLGQHLGALLTRQPCQHCDDRPVGATGCP